MTSPGQPDIFVSFLSFLRRTQLHIEYYSGATATTGLPTDRASEIVVDERADDLRSQTGSGGTCHTIMLLIGQARAIVFDHNIEVVATASHGNRDMTFFATFEAMFHGIGDQLGQHQ